MPCCEYIYYVTLLPCKQFYRGGGQGATPRTVRTATALWWLWCTLITLLYYFHWTFNDYTGGQSVSFVLQWQMSLCYSLKINITMVMMMCSTVTLVTRSWRPVRSLPQVCRGSVLVLPAIGSVVCIASHLSVRPSVLLYVSAIKRCRWLEWLETCHLQLAFETCWFWVQRSRVKVTGSSGRRSIVSLSSFRLSLSVVTVDGISIRSCIAVFCDIIGDAAGG